MINFGLTKELLETVRKLSALEVRTEDVLKEIHRVDDKLHSLIDRISRLEANHDHLKQSVRSDIMGEIKADLVRTQVMLDLSKQNMLPAFVERT